MACCLMAPSHYLNQCWLNVNKIIWHSSQGDIELILKSSIEFPSCVWNLHISNQSHISVISQKPHFNLILNPWDRFVKKFNKATETSLDWGTSPQNKLWLINIILHQTSSSDIKMSHPCYQSSEHNTWVQEQMAAKLRNDLKQNQLHNHTQTLLSQMLSFTKHSAVITDTTKNVTIIRYY